MKPERYSARDLALLILKDVDYKGAYANLALDKALELYRPDSLDRAFITELVYGSLRAQNTLDWIIDKHLNQPVKKQTSWMRNILRIGVYQIFYLDRVPSSAAVNEAVNQAKRYGHPGAEKFVNGVLRNIVRNKDTLVYPTLEDNPAVHISLKYSHPIWLVKRWLSQLGIEETIDLCIENNKPAPYTVRTNTLKTSRDKLLETLKAMGINASKTLYAQEGIFLEGFGGLRGFSLFEQGYFQPQDESSMLAAHALKPSPGSLIIDVASAPGGKSTHLAQLVNDQGTIISMDIFPHKLKLIEENIKRLGITCIQTKLGDAREFIGDLKEKADFVLLDAPCSGTGVIRRRPDSRWRKQPEQLPELLKLQREILDNVSEYLKPGGILVYSTCSVLTEENQEQIECFLERHPNFETCSLHGLLPESLFSNKESDYIQLYPHREGTDGFFICRMQKRR
ncbi:MAG: 16S rRNA (cytosine(967)-C(5))-methyltransferase RsmB [Peptococcaceae bacterium]|nr:16S rRNA (cytosine(967)-C(5))-methyltransferase RsmB [Peptococcaceae bacterium]